MIPLDVYGEWSDNEVSTLRTFVSGLLTLEQVIAWGIGQTPPRMIVNIVVQDEYCHDVVFEWHRGGGLVFDTN